MTDTKPWEQPGTTPAPTPAVVPEVVKETPKKTKGTKAPSMGRTVFYKLTKENVKTVNLQRAFAACGQHPAPHKHCVGNDVVEGREYPMTITQVWPDTVNGQVFLDGNDSLWICSSKEGTKPGEWCWPPMVG